MKKTTKRTVAIIGGGTAGMSLAAAIDPDLYQVTIYEKKNALGRKFLVAGDGGFNMSYAEDPTQLKSRYTPEKCMDHVVHHFSNQDLRDWLKSIGIPTFVGSSQRIFPEKGIKPIQVLQAIEAQLKEQQVKLKFDHEFCGWTPEGTIKFTGGDTMTADFTVFALGGASWKVTGSDGQWLPHFTERGIKTTAFQAANCAFEVKWPEEFIRRYAGEPWKNISISIDNQQQAGEVVITDFGLEGNAIYALSEQIQKKLTAGTAAQVLIDFKPTLTPETIMKKLKESTVNQTSTLRDILKLSKAQIYLLKTQLTKEEFLDLPVLVRYIKQYPITLHSAAPIDEAISTLGGIHFDAVDQHFRLQDMNDAFCIGEMLGWHAPTGGYLIQGCVSMGMYVGAYLNGLE